MHCCSRKNLAGLEIAPLVLLLLVSNLPVNDGYVCASGYKFTTIPPKEIACDPYSSAQVKVLCEITVTDDKPVDIQWYFISLSSTSPVKLVNSTKHSIVNSYRSSSLSKTVLKSVLRLQNMTDGVDTGEYVCEGSISATQKLLPKHQLTFMRQHRYDSIFECKGMLHESGSTVCANVIQVTPSPAVTYSETTSIIDLSTSISVESSTIRSLSFTSVLQSSIIEPAHSLLYDILPTSTESAMTKSTESSSSNVFQDTTKSKSTISFLSRSVITSTFQSIQIVSTGSVPVTTNTDNVAAIATNNSPVNTGQDYRMVIWLCIIVTLLAASFCILVILLVLATLILHRRSSSSLALEDVVLRQRRRQPSDPLPPIRDSMILLSTNPSETTTKTSNISNPPTTIHCAPLQNQFQSTRSLQDVTFSLQCPSAFTLYAEIEEHEQTTAEKPLVGSRDDPVGTFSSHTYTLPMDATYGDETSCTNSVTGQWSPLFIREERQRVQSLSPNGSIQSLITKSSGGDTILSDEDSCSHDYYHGNHIVCQQTLQSDLPRQTHSLTEQSFSLGGPLALKCDDNTVPSLHSLAKDSLPSLLNGTDSSLSADTTTSLQILFTDPTDSRAENSRSSSSSSSGCTDLSKYSGNYERDPDYMRALMGKVMIGRDSLKTDEQQHSTAHGQSTALCVNEEDTGCTIDEREVDSGMDGLYSGPSLDQSQLWSSSDYKSLESLTRNPSPVYMKPLWKKADIDSTVFVTITV